MNPLIFLDIDGVLNSAQWDKHHGPFSYPTVLSQHIDPRAVKRLNRLIEATDALVVISSTWRSFPALCDYVGDPNTWKRIQCLLEKARLIKDRVVGQTPTGHGIRASKISEYLELNYPGDKPVYVILDDDGRARILGRTVLTNPYVGLTSKDVDEAIAIVEWQKSESGCLLSLSRSET